MTRPRPKMDSDIRDAWCGLLEDPRYLQGKGFLRIGRRYCCLGLLCELAVKAGVCTRTWRIGTPDGKYLAQDRDNWYITDNLNTGRHLKLYRGRRVRIYAYDGAERILPDSVVSWAKTPDSNPVLSSREGDFPAAFLNDTGRYPFPQLSALIRTGV